MSCGAISSTVVRQRRSKSRIVLLSTSPSRCMPRTPSCTVCAISLRYFRLAIRSHLLELVAGDHRRDADIVEVEDHCSVILQVALVGLLIFSCRLLAKPYRNTARVLLR